MKSLKIWWMYTSNSFQLGLANRFIAVIFILGKSLRVAMFAIFLGLLFQSAKGIGGYKPDQIIFFYLAFNLTDTLAQLLFREVYRFRPLVVSGNLDLILTKPYNPLLRVLLGGADVLDFIMIILLSVITVWFGFTHITTDPVLWLVFLLMIICSIFIAAAFHIIVLGVAILTTSVDHLIMVYRDLSSMLRIPVDLYIQPIRFLLTFIIPFGIMMAFPTKVLLGLLSPMFVLISVIFALVTLALAINFWKFSLKQYSSASS